MKISIFLRKKLYGENSLEELAHNFVYGNHQVALYEFPEYSNSLKGIVRNLKFAIKHKGDVNHVFQSSGGYISIFCKNTIVTYHDLFTVFAGKKKISYLIAKLLHITVPAIFAKKLVCISEQTRNDLLKYSRLAKKKSVVIYNGRKIDFVSKNKEFNTLKPTLLHIGTAPRKNLKNIILAISGLNVHLDIVGKLNNEYLTLLKENKIDYKNYIDVPFQKIIDLYNESDIVSFPTFAEGFGMIIVEANILGKPVISSDIPIIHEIANDACLYVNPNNVQEIHDAILKLWHDKYSRESLVQRGYENAKRFSLEKMRENYYKLYQEVYKK